MFGGGGVRLVCEQADGVVMKCLNCHCFRRGKSGHGVKAISIPSILSQTIAYCHFRSGHLVLLGPRFLQK